MGADTIGIAACPRQSRRHPTRGLTRGPRLFC